MKTDSQEPRRFCHSVLFSILLLALLESNEMAQVVGATMSGTIVNTSKATVLNVTVTIKNTETGIVRSATANAAGLYSTANLQSGNYEVTASATGFGSRSAKLKLTVGAQETLPFTLKVGSTSKTVEVTEIDPTINLVDSTLGGLNNEVQIKQLPLDGSSYTDLAALQPGVYTVQICLRKAPEIRSPTDTALKSRFQDSDDNRAIIVWMV